MIATLVPDKIVTKARSTIKYFTEETVLAVEKKFGHTPVEKPRKPYNREAVKARKKVVIDEADFMDSLARKSIASCPPEVQKRIIHLQSLVPFHTPLDLGKLAVAEHNEIAHRRKQPLIGLSTSSTYVVDMIKLRYLERRIRAIKPDAHRFESLKAIRIVYPYLSEQIDAYIASLYRQPVGSNGRIVQRRVASA